jgi:hypothetical protein
VRSRSMDGSSLAQKKKKIYTESAEDTGGTEKRKADSSLRSE